MMAGGAPTLGRKPFKILRLLLPVLILALAPASNALAQTMYKYKGENGEWIYTDRKPDAQQPVEISQLETSFIAPEFTVSHDVYGRTIEFFAHNEYHAPVEVRLEFLEITGVTYPDPDQILRWVIEPRSDQLLLTLEHLEEIEAPSVEYQYEYMAGDPTAVHQAGAGYQVPFSAGMGFPITQAYPDAITHRTLDSVFAVDIAMPIGTDVLAARSGVVFDVAANNYRGGLDLSRDGQAANIVRIVHDDGSIALYAHLNWNSIRVKPGDKVRAGQYIADSGNTGFTSGPHLHFAVQRNAGLKIESMPVVFRGPNAAQVIPATGNALSSYR
jgi:murein DD-endopeptidase MepM/ murein hydrolase activator NlpD